jgi:hypothetical protein
MIASHVAYAICRAVTGVSICKWISVAFTASGVER